MKIETAIERLQELIDCNEKYEAFLTEEDDNDEELRDTELTLETLRMAARALESKPHWIPCAERLPSDENKVLCCTQTKAGAKNIVLGYYAGGKWRCGMNSNVVAWMPLPEAYSEED